MACVLVPGQQTWSMTRDAEGHRNYLVRHLVEGLVTDGPANALRTPGLPIPGSVWFFDDDLDPWAWCRLDATVKPLVENEGNTFFHVEQLFSTKPPDTKACHEQEIEDQLLQPPKVSGSFTKFTEEATRDKDGNRLVYTSFEPIRGPAVEFDNNRPTVRIEQNVADLQFALLCQMVDTVNDSGLWGLPTRCVKLSNVSWERRYYGTCYAYYTRTLEFEIYVKLDPEFGLLSGFDRRIPNESSKVIRGDWDRDTGSLTYGEWIPLDDMDPENPLHYQRAKDFNGENTRFFLTLEGEPLGTEEEPVMLFVQKYDESDFLSLDIPTTL